MTFKAEKNNFKLACFDGPEHESEGQHTLLRNETMSLLSLVQIKAPRFTVLLSTTLTGHYGGI
jgi:hypothetical protein